MVTKLLSTAAVLAALALAGCGGGSGGGGGGGGSGGSGTSTAPAPAGLQVGIGEQGLAMFSDPRFRALGIKKARLVTSYDTTSVRFERDIVDQWLAAATAAGVEPFITFGHSRVSPTKLPSVAEFRAAFRAFQKRYPAVKVYAPWNEINHSRRGGRPSTTTSCGPSARTAPCSPATCSTRRAWAATSSSTAAT
jgi:hypothetical protein